MGSGSVAGMALLYAQHSPVGVDQERIVAFDLGSPGHLTSVSDPGASETHQYVVLDGKGGVGWYRLPKGANTNLNMDRAIFHWKGADVRLPADKWNDGVVFGCKWWGNGHATITPSGTVLHYAMQLGALLGILPAPTGGLLETTLEGVPIPQEGGRQRDGFIAKRAEPNYTGDLLTYTEGAYVVTPQRRFKKLGGSLFDPIISPDGKLVAWLEILSQVPFKHRWVVGDLANGETKIVAPVVNGWGLNHPHWLPDSRTLVTGRYDPNAKVKHWALTTYDIDAAKPVLHSGPEHGDFLGPIAA